MHSDCLLERCLFVDGKIKINLKNIIHQKELGSLT